MSNSIIERNFLYKLDDTVQIVFGHAKTCFVGEIHHEISERLVGTEGELLQLRKIWFPLLTAPIYVVPVSLSRLLHRDTSRRCSKALPRPGNTEK